MYHNLNLIEDADRTVYGRGPWLWPDASCGFCPVQFFVNINSVEICTHIVAPLRHMVMEPIAPGHALPRTLEWATCLRESEGLGMSSKSYENA